MDALTYSDTRANLKAVMDRVVDDRAPVVVTRKRGEQLSTRTAGYSPQSP